MGPDFICIGAQRAGTTWLHHLLKSHPAIWVTPVKELHYFDDGHWKRYFKHLRKRNRSKKNALGLWDLRFFARYPSINWYASLFRDAQSRNLLCGELTPAYAILGPDKFNQILNMNPQIRILFIMRDPTARLWSNYVNNWSKNKTDPFSVENAISFCSNIKNIQKSLYNQTIRNLESVFEVRNLFYGFTDDIKERPMWFAEQLFSFLEVSSPEIVNVVPGSAVGVKGSKHPIPKEFSQSMAPLLKSDLEILVSRFNGHTKSWLDKLNTFL